jgi:hypothetical protein
VDFRLRGKDLLIHIVTDVAGRLVVGNVQKLKSGLVALTTTPGSTVTGKLLSEEDIYRSASMVNPMFIQSAYVTAF